jgi:hypothetical protein
MGGRRNYLPNNLHEVDAKERKKKKEEKNDGLEGGERKGRGRRRVISLFLGLGRSWCQLAGLMELPCLVEGTTEKVG